MGQLHGEFFAEATPQPRQRRPRSSLTRVLLSRTRADGQARRVALRRVGVDVAGTVDERERPAARSWPAADVAIDFSTADAVPATVAAPGGARRHVVIGTTGWEAHERGAGASSKDRIGVVAAPNFSLGVNLFARRRRTRGASCSRPRRFGAWIHERITRRRRDAPSGTALLLEAALTGGGYKRRSTYHPHAPGSIPGTHTIGFDGPAETITLTHTARDRSGSRAARWRRPAGCTGARAGSR